MDAKPPRWKWTQVADFVHPPHPRWDLIQWDLEDELVKDPRAVANPVHDPPGEWWYMRTKDAPGLSRLPAIVVLFRIVSEPTEVEPGVIEGHRAWSDEDIVDALMNEIRTRKLR